jgi:microcin C transport system permease protein
MQWGWDWNPVTVKRWRLFRRMRRAWWSLWILVALYAVSLGSELLCNNTPLWVRFEEQVYLPILKFQPEDTFLKNGLHTRPDYKKIAQTPAFTSNPRNRMVFPPIPFSPLETTDPSSITLPDAVILTFKPEPRLATVNLSRDGIIMKAVDTEFFFGAPPETLPGQSFSKTWPLPSPLRNALDSRWRNEATPSFSVVVSSSQPVPREAELYLSEFTPRSSPPATVRITLRERDGLPGAARGKVALNERLEVVSSTFPLWDSLSPETRTALIALAQARLAGPTEDRSITLNHTPYTITATRSEVSWPYKPGSGHWMGTDSAGRDVLARILYGLRTSMTFGFLLVAMAMALGTLLGALQGYFGKNVDIIGQRFTEIWSAVPFLYVMILLGAVYGRGFLMLLLCYALFNWIGISYYIRAEFLRLRHLPFVESARALGLPHRTIIFRHILPNALVPLITFFPFYLVGAIGSLAALDYLGFGLPPPTPSWGELLAQAQQFRWAWWLILYPALALFVVMLLGVFVGEGIRNAYDPRPRTKFE